jgi:thioredoxin 1
MPIDAPVHTSEANLPRVLNAGVPVILVFWRRDCAPCDQLAPALDRLAKSYSGRALIVKVNVDDEAGLVRRYGVTQLPTIVFIKDGETQVVSVGAASERDLTAWLDYMIAGSGAKPATPTGASVPLAAAQARQQPPPQPPPGPAGGSKQTSAKTTSSTEPVILTDATFDDAINTSKVPVLVDFWAPWCGPCKMVAPAVAELAKEFAGRALVAKVNVDDNQRVAGRYGIMSIPSLLIFKDGQVVDQIVGAQPAHVLRQQLSRQVN